MNETSVDRFDKQSSTPYFLCKLTMSASPSTSQLFDFSPAVADRRGNPPTKEQRDS